MKELVPYERHRAELRYELSLLAAGFAERATDDDLLAVINVFEMEADCRRFPIAPPFPLRFALTHVLRKIVGDARKMPRLRW
jgi:hypothetical protein